MTATVNYSLLRSWLFVPGDSERKLAKALGAGADAVIVDLEDAVPAHNKVAARAIAANAIASWDRGKTLVVVRINSLDSGLAFDDIAGTMACTPDALMLPKVVAPEDIRRVAAYLGAQELRCGRPPGSVRLVPIVTEHPRAVMRLMELCDADSRVAAVAWGTEDLAAAMGAHRVKNERCELLEPFRTARALTLFAASAASLASLDAVVLEIGEHDVLRQESRDAAAMGFTGKMAIHPSQVPVINDAFLPTREQVSEAQALLEASREARAGAFRFRGRMIDAPHMRIARRVISLDAAHRERE